jgi:hypothetical protein
MLPLTAFEPATKFGRMRLDELVAALSPSIDLGSASQ